MKGKVGIDNDNHHQFVFILTFHSFKDVAFNSFKDTFNTSNVFNTFVSHTHEIIKPFLKKFLNSFTTEAVII